jgi:hypothetical protein
MIVGNYDDWRAIGRIEQTHPSGEEEVKNERKDILDFWSSAKHCFGSDNFPNL